jgi:K+-transporting ATPase ATPase C chain
MIMFKEQLKSGFLVFIILTIITGVLYPLFVTGIAQAFFHAKASGSFISRDGKVVGSSLIGQPFDDPKYLWGRPSSTSPMPLNAASSSGSNLGPSNPAFLDIVKTRIEALRTADPANRMPVPVDLVTASGSGLDPHISLAGAYYQIPRIARRRGIPENAAREIVLRHAAGRYFGVIGEAIVNVLDVNLDLDSYKK